MFGADLKLESLLYKRRRQVELFFNGSSSIRIKRFFGNSENAVKTKIWCAVSTYVLIAIVKKEFQLNASLYTLLQMLSVSVFEKAEILCALQLDSMAPEFPITSNQLNFLNVNRTLLVALNIENAVYLCRG